MASQSSKSARTKTTTQPTTQHVKPRALPLFKVILHNDDKNDVVHVVQAIVLLTPLSKEEATGRMLEAHHTGCSLLLVTHKERAELYVEQFQSMGLTVTIEPAE